MKYRYGELSPTIKRNIRQKEKTLNRRCGLIWDHINPKGERYLYAHFNQQWERLIVTIGYYEPRIEKFIPVN